MNITKGEWTIRGRSHSLNNYYVGTDKSRVCQVFTTELEASENAQLIAEAGTIANQTGLSPKQLLEQRDRLISAITKRSEEEGKAYGFTPESTKQALSEWFKENGIEL